MTSGSADFDERISITGEREKENLHTHNGPNAGLCSSVHRELYRTKKRQKKKEKNMRSGYVLISYFIKLIIHFLIPIALAMVN